jgi:hypothetical protein
MNGDAEWEDWSRRWHGMPVSAGSLADRTAIPQRPRRLLSVVMIVLLLAGVAWEIFLEHSAGWAVVWLVTPAAWVTLRCLAWRVAATAGEVTAVYASAIADWSRAGVLISIPGVAASVAIAVRWIDRLSRSTHGGASSLAGGGLLLAVAICSMVLFSRAALESVRVLRFIAVLRQAARADAGEADPMAIGSMRPGGFRLGGRRRRSSKKGAV